jgi:hypothetical protein
VLGDVMVICNELKSGVYVVTNDEIFILDFENQGVWFRRTDNGQEAIMPFKRMTMDQVANVMVLASNSFYLGEV